MTVSFHEACLPCRQCQLSVACARSRNRGLIWRRKERLRRAIELRHVQPLNGIAHRSLCRKQARQASKQAESIPLTVPCAAHEQEVPRAAQCVWQRRPLSMGRALTERLGLGAAQAKTKKKKKKKKKRGGAPSAKLTKAKPRERPSESSATLASSTSPKTQQASSSVSSPGDTIPSNLEGQGGVTEPLCVCLKESFLRSFFKIGYTRKLCCAAETPRPVLMRRLIIFAIQRRCVF